MHPKEVLFRLSLYSAIIMLLIGIFMVYGNQVSDGFTFSRSGGSGSGTLTGWGAISLGIATLLFSAGIYGAWKKDVKTYNAALAEENKIIANKESKKAKRQQRSAYLKKFGG